jgi:hypothetical protein
MGDLFGLIWCAIAGLFRSRVAWQSEILVLRHQLNVLRHKSPKRVAVGSGACRPQETAKNRGNAVESAKMG